MIQVRVSYRLTNSDTKTMKLEWNYSNEVCTYDSRQTYDTLRHGIHNNNDNEIT